MQRILNNPDNIVDEMLKGFLKTHSDIVEATENPRVVKAKNIPADKVGVVTGGGSGPQERLAFVGYVGENLCDAAAVGEICSSPDRGGVPGQRSRLPTSGKGVACLYGNYSGDNMNVKMAVKMAEKARASQSRQLSPTTTWPRRQRISAKSAAALRAKS